MPITENTRKRIEAIFDKYGASARVMVGGRWHVTKALGAMRIVAFGADPIECRNGLHDKAVKYINGIDASRWDEKLDAVVSAFFDDLSCLIVELEDYLSEGAS